MASGRFLDYVAQGLAASRPVAATLAADVLTGALAVYYAYDTGVFSLLDTDAPAWIELPALNLTGEFAALADVDWSTPPTDEQIMRWSNSTGKFEPVDLAANIVEFTPAGGIAATNVQTAIEELDTEKASLGGGTFTGDISVPDDAYDATGWNANNEVPTKNAIRDKIESMGAGGATAIDDLSDVDTTTVAPVAGDLLRFDGTNWVPGSGMVRIAQIVVGSAQAELDFTSIAADYENLMIIYQARGTNASTEVELRPRFNNDAGSNYDLQQMHTYSSGTGFTQAVGSAPARMAYIAAANAPAGSVGSGTLTIPAYARTVFNKSMLSEWKSKNGTGTFTQGRGSYGMEWRDTAAITRITLALSAGNFDVGSVATLYGIK